MKFTSLFILACALTMAQAMANCPDGYPVERTIKSTGFIHVPTKWCCKPEVEGKNAECIPYGSQPVKIPENAFTSDTK